jgi:transposase
MERHEDRIGMNQYERDLIKIMEPVLQGKRTQGEAARLLRLTERQVRRLQRRLESAGDAGVVHRLRGRPSNRRLAEDLRETVLTKYREHFGDFGPTLASEKLAELGLEVSSETLRRWLLAEGLWEQRRHRDPHRRRRPRRSCFGELVQMDASLHEWTEGRGETMLLMTMIDDATSRIDAGFYVGETVENYMDLTERWLRRHGRPLALYTDRDSVFQSQSQGRAVEGITQFGRALKTLGIELILAYSPQAKGRVERFFGTAQDRWVKELRLEGVQTRDEANALLRRRLVPEFNRRFTKQPLSTTDAHRALGRAYDLAAILCSHHERTVTNDYTVRWRNRLFQIEPPAHPGLRGGKVVLQERRDGTLRIRFGEHYLNHHEIALGEATKAMEAEAPGVGSVAGTPVGLRPPSVPATDPTPKKPYRPAPDHPWRGNKPK